MLQIEVVVSQRDFESFIELPARIYRDQAGFRAPLNADRAMLLDPRRNGKWRGKPTRYWIAKRNGEPVGRIAAQVPPRLPVGFAPATGTFGCFDAVDDPQVTERLFAAARRWLEQQGCSHLIGPISLGMNEEPGLLVDGAAEPPMILYPWHPPYLEDHLQRIGLAPEKDLHSWRLDLAKNKPQTQASAGAFAGRIPGLRVRHPTFASFKRDIELLCEIYNDGWQTKWGFEPLTPEDLAGLDLLMKLFVPREAFKIIEIDGLPVAVILLIPNLLEATADLGARPGLLGWLKLASRLVRRQFKSGRIIVTGLVDKLQGSIKGSIVASLLVEELISSHAVLHGDYVEAGWVLEDNWELTRILERFEFKRIRTFRIFGQQLHAIIL